MEENLIIRKITIGDLKKGLTYQVGQKMMAGDLQVTAIIQDERTWIKNQQVVYDVYVKAKGESISRPWKRFFNQPTAIEYKISIEDNYKVY